MIAAPAICFAAATLAPVDAGLTITPAVIEVDDTDTAVTLDLSKLLKARLAEYTTGSISVDNQKRADVAGQHSLTITVTSADITALRSTWLPTGLPSATSRLSINITVTGVTGRVSRANLRVNPTCGTVLGIVPDFSGKLVPAYSNGRYIGVPRHNCANSPTQNAVAQSQLAAI